MNSEQSVMHIFGDITKKSAKKQATVKSFIEDFCAIKSYHACLKGGRSVQSIIDPSFMFYVYYVFNIGRRPITYLFNVNFLTILCYSKKFHNGAVMKILLHNYAEQIPKWCNEHIHRIDGRM